MASALISQGLGSPGSVPYLLTMGLDIGDPIQLDKDEADLRTMPRRRRTQGLEARDRERTMQRRRRREAA